MINFKLKPYEWQKSMDILLQNINLSKIEFPDNLSVSFTFLNSYDGSFYKKILCHNVWKFSKTNYSEEKEDFPLFICDVKIAKLECSNIESAFAYLKYDFNIPYSNEYILLCMDSGDININLICETIETA